MQYFVPVFTLLSEDNQNRNCVAQKFATAKLNKNLFSSSDAPACPDSDVGMNLAKLIGAILYKLSLRMCLRCLYIYPLRAV
jgi:hypothetical protein